ncbi:MAG: C4-dicarboxylate ABC transporter [Bdellovibrionaceae bacterium]|nr:C4-dicarboxylate ABC transporter [Pseudobdellovibrionaceae bacterium]|tara:strand:+ start:707 stop:2077 length:1371 start_codon:yes stop_codon:yes gene_type:complete
MTDSILNEFPFFSILPSFFAIGLVLWTRQVVISLFIGLVLGGILVKGGVALGIEQALDWCVSVFQSKSSTRVILFSSMVGGWLSLTHEMNGLTSLSALLSQKVKIKTQRQVRVFSFLIGCGVFLESSLTCLVAGTVSGPLYDRLKLGRLQLAYLIDATSAPICILIPLNGWGAYLVGLLESQGVQSPVETLVASIFYNFYAWGAVLVAGVFAWKGFFWGPLKDQSVEFKNKLQKQEDSIDPFGVIQILGSLFILFFGVIGGLWITGKGDLMKGSGSTSVFWAIFAATVFSLILWRWKRGKLDQGVDFFFKGTGEFLPLSVLMIFAFAIGEMSTSLQTGPIVAEFLQGSLSSSLFPAGLFITASIVAFSTGTSWGTFALLIPIAAPMATPELFPLYLGAVLSGGVFGDHASPLSDTTIIASLSAQVEPYDHVRTQIPYAGLGGVFALGLFLGIGLLL